MARLNLSMNESIVVFTIPILLCVIMLTTGVTIYKKVDDIQTDPNLYTVKQVAGSNSAITSQVKDGATTVLTMTAVTLLVVVGFYAYIYREITKNVPSNVYYF